MEFAKEFSVCFGQNVKATYIQKASSPELWCMWGTFAGALVNVREVLVNMARWARQSGQEKGVIAKGVFSLEESLESLQSLNSLESLEDGRILLSFPQFRGSLESLNSLET